MVTMPLLRAGNQRGTVWPCIQTPRRWTQLTGHTSSAKPPSSPLLSRLSLPLFSRLAPSFLLSFSRTFVPPPLSFTLLRLFFHLPSCFPHSSTLSSSSSFSFPTFLPLPPAFPLGLISLFLFSPLYRPVLIFHCSLFSTCHPSFDLYLVLPLSNVTNNHFTSQLDKEYAV